MKKKPPLTAREVEVCVLAGCITTRMSDKAIGKELGIGARTVQTHMANGAKAITVTFPHLRGSPRRVCQGWVRMIYHAAAFERIMRHRFGKAA